CLLRQVFGLRGVVDESAHQAADPPPMAAHQLCKRLLVSRRYRLHQLIIAGKALSHENPPLILINGRDAETVQKENKKFWRCQKGRKRNLSSVQIAATPSVQRI